MADPPPIIVFHDDHEECDKRLTAAQATIRSLKIVLERVEADNSELRKQRDEFMAERDHAREARDGALTEVARLNATIVRLTNEADVMTLGMPDPCQPIGCDNGHHLPGCVYAEGPNSGGIDG